MGYLLSLFVVVILSILGIGSGIYLIAAIIKDKPLLHIKKGNIVDLLIGSGKRLKFYMMIGGIGWTVGWIVVLFALLFNL